RVDVVSPAAVERWDERLDAVLRGVGGAVGVNADHQGRVSDVAEPGACDVAARVRRTGARHRDPVAVPLEQRARAQCDCERNRRLAGSPAPVLDLPHARARADRLRLASDRGEGAVTGIEADEGGWRNREQGQEVCLWECGWPSTRQSETSPSAWCGIITGAGCA